jgi:hypothetical protein
MDPESQQRLKNLLRDSKTEAELPPRFESEVWHRIASSQEKRASRWNFDWLFRVTAQPRLAFAVVVAAMILGGGLASWRAQENYHHELAVGEAHYIQSVDPLAQASLASNP